MTKKKAPISLKLVSYFFLIHGICYLLGIAVALYIGIWDSLLSFLFGNIILHKMSIFIPFVLGCLYIVVALGLLKHKHWARIGAVSLCSTSLFLEFPIGTILSATKIFVLLRPSVSPVFGTKINRKAYHTIGITLFLVSLLIILNQR